MKKTLVLLLLPFCFMINSSGQQKVNLKGDYYPNQLPAEDGYGTVTHHSPYESFNYIHLSSLKQFLTIDAKNATLMEMGLLFSIGKTDTTYLSGNGKDTITIIRDSIPEFTPYLCFSESNTSHIMALYSILFCGKFEHRFSMQLELIAPRKLRYRLYYQDDCNKNSKSLLRYGTIRMREKKGDKLKTFQARNEEQ